MDRDIRRIMGKSAPAARRSLSLLFALTLSCAWLPAAAAEVSRTYEHSWDQVWSGTVRLLRVDRGFKIEEKDADTGYILFEFKDSPRDERGFRGSAELIRDEDSAGRPVVKLTFRIVDKSSIPHDVLHRALKEKLTREYGSPLPPPKRKKKAPPADGDDEGKKDDEEPSSD